MHKDLGIGPNDVLLGEDEHINICHSFAHFAAFGIMEHSMAVMHLDGRSLRSQDVLVPPLSKPVTVIALTPKGRKESKACMKIWKTFYMPLIKPPHNKLTDDYVAGEGEGFMISHERLKQELAKGNLQEVIKKCLPVPKS